MTSPEKILAVDDEPKILEVVSSVLTEQGFTVFTAETGREALGVFERENIALVLLDLMLPDISGEEICSAIRKKSRVPIIMLTAKVEEENMLEGLNIGADDYITKPFSLKILRARVNAVLRRAAEGAVPLFDKLTLCGGDLEIDFTRRAVTKAGAVVKLTPSEYNILSAIARHPARVFTRDELIGIALGDDFGGYDRAVDSHIKNLRHKIETDHREPVYVVTVHGMGYKFGRAGEE
jgi:DNA-binding response OmpR family regulator